MSVTLACEEGSLPVAWQLYLPHVWVEIREKEFPNRVFNDLPSVIRQLETGLPRLAANTKGLQSLTAWPWIISLNLNAT